MTARIYTIGHSNHPADRFQDLLGLHDVEVLVDVRSQPTSRYAPHFNQDLLRQAVVERGRKYIFLGRELGGRPDGAQYYDEEGYVRYDRVAEAPLFKHGIGRLLNGVSRFRVALMCSEEDPTGCHRRLLVGRVLLGHGVEVDHVRGDGSIQSEHEIQALDARLAAQGLLFGAKPEERAWRSLRSVLRSTAPSSSSGSSARRESAA